MRPPHFFIALIAFLSFATAATAQFRAVKVAYYGESITHYGVKAGYERSFSSNVIQNRKGPVTKEWLYGGGLAIYRHPHNHIGIILAPEIGWRRTSSTGRFIEAAFAPSLFRYFYEGKTFEVNDGGSFDRIALAGRTAFLPSLSFGFGKDLEVKRNIPFMWYSRLNFMKQFPYNASSLTRVSIELGIIRKLK